jgi:hypothetical protein
MISFSFPLRKQILFALFYLGHLVIYGQNRVSVEVFGDFGFSHISGDYFALKKTGYFGNDYTTEKMKDSITLGYGAGLLIQYTLTNHISIGSGCSYAKRGQFFKAYSHAGRFQDTLSGNYQDHTTNQKAGIYLHYINLPVLLYYKFTPRNNISLSMFGGISFNFLAKYKMNYTRIDNGTVYTWNGTDYTPNDFYSIQQSQTSGNSLDITYSVRYTLSPGGDSHIIFPLDGQIFKKFDPQFVTGIKFEWKINEWLSIPFGLVYKRGFKDIKEFKTRITNNTFNPPIISDFWSGEYNSSNPFINSSFSIEVGLIYKFSPGKRSSTTEENK